MRICVRTLKKKLTVRTRVRICHLVKSFRIKPERRNRPTNLTLDPEIKTKAIQLARELGYHSLSEWVAELLQAEISRNASLLQVSALAGEGAARGGRSPTTQRRTNK